MTVREDYLPDDPLPSPGFDRVAYRPDPPDSGLGRMLRGLAGVREDVLDWTPEDRPRYTRLGAIILNTGLLASLSLTIVLSHFAHVSALLIAPFALFWGYVIICIDSWLISSTHGILTGSRWRIFVPRLAISILLGVSIAEPIVLWVFDSAIKKDILDHRHAELADYESRLVRCNSSTPTPAAATQESCAPYKLNIADSAEAIRTQLAGLEFQRDKLGKEVLELNSQLANLQDLARKECDGTPGPGLTGVYGAGVNCRENRQDAQRFRQDNQIDTRQAKVNSLSGQIADAQARLSEAERDSSAKVAQAISLKVAERRGNQAEIGLLDEVASLGRLTSESWFVFIASWVLRLLLVAVDCLPVLTKVFSTSTAYDELISRQTSTGRRLHQKTQRLKESQDDAVADVNLHQTEYDRQTKLDLIEDADRAARARREAQLEEDIEELARRLRGAG